MEEEVLECCDSESPTEMPATVNACGLATELEKCEVRRIVNHEERKQARQKLRNESYATAQGRVQISCRHITKVFTFMV